MFIVESQYHMLHIIFHDYEKGSVNMVQCVWWIGLGKLCSKIRPLCCVPMLPTTGHYALVGYCYETLTDYYMYAWNLISN